MRYLPLALILGFAACNPTVGAPCVADTDCGSDQVCSEGSCAAKAAAAADAGPVRGDECMRAFDCVAGEQCVNGYCTGGQSGGDAGNPPNGDCRSDEDCERMQGCHEGTCHSRCFNDDVCERTEPGTICMDDPDSRLGLCLPPECESATDCGPNQDCEEGRCVSYTPCENDSDCGDGQFCGEDGRCDDRETCLRDADCEDGQTCTDGYCFDVPRCDEGQECPAGTECVGGNCVEAICRSNDQCEDNQVCTAGRCETPEVVVPDRVLIITPYGTCDSGNAGACRLPLTVGDEVQLHAMALDVNGEGIAGLPYRWASSDGAAAVNGTGQLSAAGAGTALITVTAAEVESRPVTVTIVEAVETGRLRVVNGRGQAVGGASVAINNQWQAATTEADGSLDLSLPNGSFSLSVFKEGHDQIVVAGLAHSAATPFDGVLALPVSSAGTAAGFTGTVDFSRVNTQGSGDLGITGVSLPDLLSFDLPGLVGDTFDTPVSIPGLGSQTVPIPGGVTFRATQPIQLEIKNTVYARGNPGVRTAWSFAGRVDALGLFGNIQGAGDIGAVVAAILPQVESFDHGLLAGLNLSALDEIADVDDIDGDGDTQEIVANWRRFPSRTLRPSVPQNGRTIVILPGSDGADFQVVVGGVLHPGTGFVPLGLTSRETAQPQRVPFAIAPAYGGLEGSRYAFATMALRDAGETTQAQVLVNDQLAVEQRFSAHLALPTTVERSRLDNRVSMSAVPGAHLIRFMGRGPGGDVAVYAPAGADRASITVPVPAGEVAGARLATVVYDAITLSSGAAPDDSNLMNRLLGSGQVVLRNVAMHATGFVRKQLIED